ncbi:hypothetical protein BCR35DRAFT_352612 [Leucosporidium creatinivorum]|uniref:Uncharacterized protein n=1 Tax=Leucosporidium creatinivorum TaxID=106004 RepID=A0A1Y2F8S9_9BASI|nr:hypothetical protein BCR35DRAFT_352612 [Leucosporidium creatinivorum]
MEHRDDSNHVPERADQTPPSPKSRSPQPKLEHEEMPQLLPAREKLARVDKGKQRAVLNASGAADTAKGATGTALGGLGAEPLGDSKSRSDIRAQGQQGRLQDKRRTSEIIDLTLDDDDDDQQLPPAPTQKQVEPENDSDIEIIEDPQPRPPPRASAPIAHSTREVSPGPVPAPSTVPLKRVASVESLNNARSKGPRLSSTPPQLPPQAAASDRSSPQRSPSLHLSPDRKASEAPSPIVSYPTPVDIDEPPPSRLLLRHPDGKTELIARVPPPPPPDSVLYRPPGFGNLPRISGHFDPFLQNAMAAGSPPPQATTTADASPSPSHATSAIPRLSPTLHRRPTQFGAMQPLHSPQNSTTSLHRRTPSAANFAPTSLSIPTSSPPRPTSITQPLPLTLGFTTSSPQTAAEKALADRLEHWKEEVEGSWPFHLLRIPHSDDTPPPELENLADEAWCKGYPNRRKVTRGADASASSGAGEGAGGSEGTEDKIEDVQMMEAFGGDIEQRPWEVTGLAEMVVDEDGNEEWRGAPSLPTRRSGNTSLARKMEQMELKERKTVFGYGREVALREEALGGGEE